MGNLKINNKYIRYFVNKKFAVDAVCMAIFWVIVYTPVYLYTSKSFEAALIGLGSSAVLEIFLVEYMASLTIMLERRQA